MLKPLLSNTGMNALGFALGLAAQLTLARWLNVEEYGLFSFFYALVMTLSIFALLGFPQAVMRLTENNSKTNAALWWFTTFICTLIGFILGLTTLYTAQSMGIPTDAPASLYTSAFAMLLPIIALRLFSAHLKAQKRPVLATMAEITAREALLLLVLAILYITGTTPSAQALIEILALICTSLAIVTACKTMTFAPRRDMQETIIKNAKTWTIIALPMMLTMVAQMLMHRTDILMIGAMTNAFNTGLYSIASKLAQIVGLPMMALGAVYMPLAAALFKKNNTTALTTLFRKNRLFLMISITSLCLALGIASPYLLPLFGPAYTKAQAALLILLGGNIINSIWGPVVFTLIMSNQERLTMVVTIASALLNIALNIILIDQYGIEGAALATVISINAKNASLSWFMHKRQILNEN